MFKKYCGLDRNRNAFVFYSQIIEQQSSSSQQQLQFYSQPQQQFKDTQIQWDSRGTQIKYAVTVRPTAMTDPTIIWQNTRPAQYLKQRNIGLVIHPVVIQISTAGMSSIPATLFITADGFTGSYMADGTPTQRIAALNLVSSNSTAQTAIYQLGQDQVSVVPFSTSVVRLRLRIDDSFNYVPSSSLPAIFTIHCSYIKWISEQWKDNLREQN